jgi:uncharacterized spore protein YtfJ
MVIDINEPRYLHLNPLSRPIAALPDEERRRLICRDRWIGYTAATEALAKFEELLTYPQKQRMPNLLLIGPTNNGKSKIIRRFLDITDPRIQPEGKVIRNVLSVEMPPEPGMARFYGVILRELSVPYHSGRPAGVLEPIALDMLRQQEVKLLIVDEIHNLLACTARKQREVLNQLKYIGNQVQIPLIGVGTEDAWDAIKNDAQLANRFEPFVLPLWSKGPQFLALLVSFGQLFPLRRPSHMADEKIADIVLARTDRSIGEITKLLEKAALQAIADGSECLTAKLIAAAPYMSPSERRRQFAATAR